jgi:hypothetical protein
VLHKSSAGRALVYPNVANSSVDGAEQHPERNITTLVENQKVCYHVIGSQPLPAFWDNLLKI